MCQVIGFTPDRPWVPRAHCLCVGVNFHYWQTNWMCYLGNLKTSRRNWGDNSGQIPNYTQKVLITTHGWS